MFWTLTVPYHKTYDVRQFAAVRKHDAFKSQIALFSHLAMINSAHTSKKGDPCRPLYSKRKYTQPIKIGCSDMHLLIENVAAKLNYSVTYVTGGIVHDYNRVIGQIIQMPYSVFVYMRIQLWIVHDNKIVSDNTMKQVLRGESDYVFIYCKNSLEREGFRVTFWTIPFDKCSWILIGVSALALTILLKGNWFPVFSILMRQECRILNGRQKILVIFILVTIIFTHGYEGVVSSFLTVQPPVIKIKNLKELYADSNGYKLLAAAGSDMSSLKSVFDRENISERLVNGIEWLDWKEQIVPDRIVHMLVQCNRTYSIRREFVSVWKIEIKKLNDKINCNSVKESSIHSRFIHQYFGPHFLKFIAVEQIFIESGVWTHFTDFERYLEQLRTMKKQEEAGFNESLPISFTIMDWKVMSTFVGWVALLLGAALVFAAETFISYRRKLVGNFNTNPQNLRIWKFLRNTLHITRG